MNIRNLLIWIEVTVLSIVLLLSPLSGIITKATSIETSSTHKVFVEYATATW